MKNFKLSFTEKEQECELRFQKAGTLWHACTPGNLQEILFIDEKDFMKAITFLGVCAAELHVIIYAYAIMSNHIHLILSGTREDARETVLSFRRKIMRYLSGKGRNVLMTDFDCNNPLPIETLRSLRNEIIYTNRNNYVSDARNTPFSCPWTSGYYYFNDAAMRITTRSYSKFSYREQREILGGRSISLPDTYTVGDGYLYPPSFVHIEEGQSFFRDAHQYFTLLGKNYEAYSEIARKLGDTTVIPDEEFYSLTRMLSSSRFSTKDPRILPQKEKFELAKILHSDYAATNGQLQRILRLDRNVIDSLFPLPH